MILQDEDQNSPEEEKLTLFNIKDCSRKQVTFCLVMFFYSFGTIGNLAFYSLLKDVYGLQPATLNIFYTVISMLFVFKPLYGFITDHIYIFGRRRQPYIIIGGFAITILWILMGYFAVNAYIATTFMSLINVILGIINTAAQALVIEDSQNEENKEIIVEYNNNKAVKNVSMFFGIDSIGLLISSYLSGYLVDTCSLRTVFLVSAGISSLVSLSGFALSESKLINDIRTTQSG